MKIHEYVLAAIEEGTLQPAIELNVFELRASIATHYKENRLFFIKNTPEERIRAVISLLAYAGNPMTQIFAVEFLWRIVLLITLSPAEKVGLFGPMSDHLISISAHDFRPGILNCIEVINANRIDPDRIHQVKIHDLMIGEVGASLEYTMYVGTDTVSL
jgi:hypothetical protein